MTFERSAAEGDDRGPERVRPAPWMAHDIAGVGQHGEQGVGRGDVDARVGSARSERRELLCRMGGEEVEDVDRAGGGECRP